MKKMLFFFLLIAVVSIPRTAYAQNSVVRLGVSSASYNNSNMFDNSRVSIALGTEGSFYYIGVRADFDSDWGSAYANLAQLELGPKFLRAGPGLMFGGPNGNNTQLRLNCGMTFNPWRGFYLNSRWAPVSLNSRPNSKNFLDASVGWQFKF